MDFVVCPSCGLQHRARADGACPRCTARDAARISERAGSRNSARAERFEDSAAGRRLRFVLVAIIVLAVTGAIFAVLSFVSPSPHGGRGYGRLVMLLGLAIVGIWSWGRGVLRE